jgi:hypothetical protein
MAHKGATSPSSIHKISSQFAYLHQCHWATFDENNPLAAASCTMNIWQAKLQQHTKLKPKLI